MEEDENIETVEAREAKIARLAEKIFVKLPPRTEKCPHNICGSHTIESRPHYWQMELLGRVAIPTRHTCNIRIGNKNKSMPNSQLLLLFQDQISKKVFWWVGKRSMSDHLTLPQKGGSCRHWPVELFQITKSNFKTFVYMVYGFGAEASLAPEQRVAVQKQKIAMVRALEDLRHGE